MPHLNPSDANEYGGKWSIQKLRCVEKYLEAYLQVMRRRSFELWYIDAFSGDGIQRFNETVQDIDRIEVYTDAEMGKFTRGSSLRALKVSYEIEQHGNRGFDHFVFIEYDETKLNDLKGRIEKEFPSQFNRCEFRKGDVNAVLPQVVQGIPWSSSARGVCFIDPWATQLSWSVLESVSKTKCDVWLLFPIETINRLMPRKGYPKPSLEKVICRLYGDDGWKDRYSSRGEQLTLFNQSEEIIRRDKGSDWLIEYTAKRLKTIFAGVSEPGILERQDHVVKFALFGLISNNSKRAIEIGLNIANHIVKSAT